MTRFLTTAALAAVFSAGGGALLTQATAPDGARTALTGAASAQEAEASESAAEVTEMVMGDADAPVEVIEYGSFTCPHCARFATDVMPQIEENYIETGKVKFIHREVYFDKYGMWASLVARCGGQEKYFGIADMIYSTQNEWVRQDSEAGIADGLRKIGLMAGIGQEKLDACMQDGEKLRTLVEWYQENATRDGIESTPSFMIDGELYSNMPYDEFAEILDERVAAAE
ncbi:DsbA family protein [Salipiger mucosus]|uniref:Periplasmic thiol:disulfide interchange protein DsbA n=1 Tax=Salipiger mucosus DSM 16094 TaxID=1123237 RepID=S9RNU1_9RHOB|nr:DsbA family protein [Salipiger mucosus]EPX79755.1 Periplasmic thiol:disulfide interchange protein DsbA [Salipiger mucosus DSM 16094]